MTRRQAAQRLLIDFRSRYAIATRPPKQVAAPAPVPAEPTAQPTYPPMPDSTANLVVTLLPLLAGAAIGSAMIGKFPRAFHGRRRRR